MKYKYLKTWRNKTKSVLAECLGGKCNKCGYNTYLGSLDFHHRFDKKELISNMLKCPTQLKIIVEEAKKCILLCKNCHYEFHGDFWSEDDIDIFEFDEEILSDLTRKKLPICQFCKTCVVENSRYKFCSSKCREANRTKRIPSRDILEKLLWEQPMTKIGKLYNVSDKAVLKWARKYDLQKPPRGYWLKTKKITNTIYKGSPY